MRAIPLPAASEQYVWDPRYIDAPVLRQRDTDSDGSPDETLNYTTDAHFNVTALIDASTGLVVERYTYSPYGHSTVLDADGSFDADGVSDVANALGFQGTFRDAETGLHHVRHRMYHPTLGIWATRDPSGYPDGLNAYAAYHVLHGGLDPSGLRLTEHDHRNHQTWIRNASDVAARARVSAVILRSRLASDPCMDGCKRRFLMETAEYFDKLAAEREEQLADVIGSYAWAMRLDGIQEVLDYGGAVPILGTPADLINTLISTIRGDYADAVANAVGVLPLGEVVKGARFSADLAAVTRRGGEVAAKAEAAVAVRTGGRLGNQVTRSHVGDVAAELESRGWTVTGGGGIFPEEYLPGPGGGRLGSNWVDITVEKNGRILRINTIDTLADGLTPTTREAAAAAAIRAKSCGVHLLLVPKPK
jgi:RHS repeat-associated protein